MVNFPHLDTIDAAQWPSVANVPSVSFGQFKARRAEAEFAKTCDLAEIDLDPETDSEDGPDMEVLHDALFTRIAATGWLGFAESYLAGEWTTENSEKLVKVLRCLLQTGYRPKAKELAPELSAPGSFLWSWSVYMEATGLHTVVAFLPVGFPRRSARRFLALANRRAGKSRKNTLLT